MRLLEKIFSIKNDNNHKIMTVFGIKIKFKIRSNILNNIEQINSKLEFIEKQIQDIYYDNLVAIKAPFLHKYISKFKNCYKDKSIACIACGPTVNYFKPANDMVLCGVNRATRKFDNLDILFRQDNDSVDKSFNKEMDSYKGNDCIKFFGIHSPHRLSININNGMNIDRIPASSFLGKNVYPFLLDDMFHAKWAIDLEVEPFGDIGGIVYSALQFLLYTNPKRIYLVGHDCNEGFFYNTSVKQDYRNRVNLYVEFKGFVERIYPNIEIVSINPVGLKGLFKDVYTQSYVDDHPELKDESIEIINEEDLCNNL